MILTIMPRRKCPFSLSLCAPCLLQLNKHCDCNCWLLASVGVIWTGMHTRPGSTPERMAPEYSVRNWRSHSLRLQVGYYDPHHHATSYVSIQPCSLRPMLAAIKQTGTATNGFVLLLESYGPGCTQDQEARRNEWHQNTL